MLEDLISAFVRSQFGDVRRRTTGALLEAGALGMVGLATVFVSIGAFFWLSARLEMWLAAVIVAAVALGLAIILMLAGRSLIRRKALRRETDVLSGLEALSALTGSSPESARDNHRTDDPGAAIVGAALAAGVLLGRSFKR